MLVNIISGIPVTDHSSVSFNKKFQLFRFHRMKHQPKKVLKLNNNNQNIWWSEVAIFIPVIFLLLGRFLLTTLPYLSLRSSACLQIQYKQLVVFEEFVPQVKQEFFFFFAPCLFLGATFNLAELQIKKKKRIKLGLKKDNGNLILTHTF